MYLLKSNAFQKLSDDDKEKLKFWFTAN